MSEDIEKTIRELHIYEKKLLKELEANRKATPEEIAENANMDIKSVMSAAGSLASKDIIEVDKEVEETYSLTENGIAYAEKGLPERRILNALAEKKEIQMKDLASETGMDKKEANIALGWLRRKDWAQIDKGVLNITDFGKEFADKLDNDEEVLNYLKANADGVKLFTDDLRDGFGINYFKSEDKLYIGFWKNNKRCGFGKIYNQKKMRYGLWFEQNDENKKTKFFGNEQEAMDYLKQNGLYDKYKKFFECSKDELIKSYDEYFKEDFIQPNILSIENSE